MSLFVLIARSIKSFKVLFFNRISLRYEKDKVFKKDPENKYLVETILFDDLLQYLPKNKYNETYKTALMKIGEKIPNFWDEV